MIWLAGILTNQALGPRSSWRTWLFIIASVLPMASNGQELATAALQPPQPPQEIQSGGLSSEAVNLRTYSTGAPFDPATHKGIYTDWPDLQQKYLQVLRNQVLNQDVWHQAESKAHFDNCDFRGSTKYIRELKSEVDAWARLATASRSRNDLESADREITEAYRSIGKLLHGVQDFYAHSNYVEMLVDQVRRDELSAGSLPSKTILVWDEGGEKDLDDLQKLGLVSGVVWWGFPKQCAPGTLTHGALAKDGNKGKGAEQVAELANQSLHKLALDLAAKASVQFIEFAWETWPVLALGKPRDSFPLEIFVDRRKHE
jgi:hypothetical protein